MTEEEKKRIESISCKKSEELVDLERDRKASMRHTSVSLLRTDLMHLPKEG